MGVDNTVVGVVGIGVVSTAGDTAVVVVVSIAAVPVTGNLGSVACNPFFLSPSFLTLFL
jgi:hypothetical protein